ncbi:MAG: SDR family oxidoreductase [Gemmatimonadetes bacterium]|nr:SDR family oxidoreductase [Gemmatimonadota bacterium]MBI3567688.1 SDR family oxidoreductase [Gemmatimonadota bacterium]
MTDSASGSGRPAALITGATAGIGKVFAQQLAEQGHDLVLVARDAARLQALCDELSLQFGINAEAIPADLSRDEGMRRVGERIAQMGSLTMLVNNAGFGTKGKLANRPVAEQATMLELHVMAPMLLSRAALPGMIARGRGAIINVASVASFAFSAGNVNYCATKAYLRFFSLGLAQELAGTGVYVQALCPGFTHTEFHDRGGMNKKAIPGILWLKADRVVRESLAEASRGRKVVVVPGKRYKTLVFLIKYAPEWLLSIFRGRYGKARV